MSDLTRAKWRKSSYSSAEGNCVEVALVDAQIAVRDSKHKTGPALVYTRAEWEAFLSGARDGEFNLANIEDNRR